MLLSPKRVRMEGAFDGKVTCTKADLERYLTEEGVDNYWEDVDALLPHITKGEGRARYYDISVSVDGDDVTIDGARFWIDEDGIDMVSIDAFVVMVLYSQVR